MENELRGVKINAQSLALANQILRKAIILFTISTLYPSSLTL